MAETTADSLTLALTPGYPPRRKPLQIQRFLTLARVPAGLVIISQLTRH
jgi:hypothetical protein